MSLSKSEHKYHDIRYLLSSVLPAIAGTTLPLWLKRPDFSIKWLPAVEFLLIVILGHGGFCLIYRALPKLNETSKQQSPQFLWGLLSFAIAILTAVHLNNHLTFQSGVPDYIFIIYCLTALFAGALYVLPPFSFYRHRGGEMVLSIGLGMLPFVGAYLIQTGVLTRTVYIASFPLVAATGLWVWVEELLSAKTDAIDGRQTLVNDFGLRFSARYGLVILSGLLMASIIVSVISGSLHPVELISILIIAQWSRLIVTAWKSDTSPDQMGRLVQTASTTYLIIAIILASSSILTLFIL